MLTLEMDRDDWRKLHEYLEAANKVKGLIEEAEVTGKQQVSIKHAPVERFVSLKLPPDFWLKLGSLIGSKLQEE
jgi:hypothetical protein